MKYYIKQKLRESLLNEDENLTNNYNTSVVALFHNDKMLILKRGATAPWMPNKWSLVGGEIDDDENPKQAALRECKEEINLIPINLQYQKKIKTNDIGIIHYFIGDLTSNNITLDYENSEYKFITKDEINNYPFVPYLIEFINTAFNNNIKQKLSEGFISLPIEPYMKDFMKDLKSIIIKGVTYEFMWLTTTPNVDRFIIEVEDGGEIGRATLNKDGYFDNIRIHKDYRRLGLATKMYQYVEELIGKKLKPSPIKQSKEIRNFWAKVK